MTSSRKRFNKVKISGGNSINFSNNCILSGIKLHNVNRTNPSEYIFEISDNDYNKIKEAIFKYYLFGENWYIYLHKNHK